MNKFYLNKAKGYLKLVDQNEDGIFVNETPQFKGKVMIGKKKIEIKLYPAYKPGGPHGAITKNPNKYVIEIGGKNGKSS
jgi:hypothetical protein